MAIRVVLVEAHAPARERSRTLLSRQNGVQVLESLGNNGEAVRRVCDAQPDIVVIALSPPDPAGIDVLKQLHDLCVDGKIVALSSDAHLEYVDRVLRAGANGYVLKASAEAELAEAVRAVHAGRRYLGQSISTQALEEYERRRGPVPPIERLTPRELQVLTHLVDGKPRNDIARALGISPKSVDTYKSRMMLKLELEHLPALVKFAIRHGLTRI